MKKIIIHAGDHKTGTSSIQFALSRRQNDGESDYKALNYPVAGRGGRMAHHNLAWETQRKINRFRPKMGGWKEIAEEIRASDAALTVISTEALEGTNPAFLKDAIDTHLSSIGTVEVIVYVRPHFPRLLSAYNQKTKTGQINETIESFIEGILPDGGLINFSGRLTRWRDALGSMLSLRVFDREALAGGDILDDFFGDALGLDASIVSEIKGMSKVTNVSPGVTTLDIVSRYTRALNLDTDSDLAIKMEPLFLNVLRNKMQDFYPEDKAPGIPLSHAQALYDAALPDAERLDREFFHDTPIFANALRKGQAKTSSEKISPQYRDDREIELHQAYANVILAIIRKGLNANNKDKKGKKGG